MILDPFAPWLLLFALFADALIGDPPWLWRRIPHPVVIMGRLIGLLDNNLNRETWPFATRRVAGIIALLMVMSAAAGVGMVLQPLLHNSIPGKFIEVLIVTVLLAQRSLYEHVAGVKQAFDHGGLPAARVAVSRIVGRDPEALDGAGVCRAAIETTAENFSDGIVAPAFWYLFAGLPGILAYKAVNTADSMIGHRSERYRAFGWAAARLDDLLNYIPARISGALLTAAAPAVGGSAKGALNAMLRDARKHRSANAGWPEAAMAGALGLALAGPRIYASGRVEDAWMNACGRPNAKPSDIASALRLFVAGCLAHAFLVAVVGLIAQLL